MESTSLPPKFFAVHERYATYHPVADLGLEAAVELIDHAIRYCRFQEIAGVLVNINGLTGFSSPSLTDRFWFIRKWAETSGGRVVLAMVARPEMIMPDKIGITMALNRGLRSDVFSDEAEALAWLNSECFA